MNKVTTSGPIAVGTDTTFRAMVADYHALLAACGLVRTSDTGQIVDASATWPVANFTDAGFSVWRFDDSLQATAPIFIKITFGRANGATTHRGTLEVGVATDGAGNMVGLTSGAHVVPSTASAAGNYNSYVIHCEGFAGVAFKCGAGNANVMPYSFFIQRTVDNNGNPTGDGVQILRSSTSPGTTQPSQTCRLRFAPTTESTGFVAVTTCPVGFIPGGLTDARVNLSPQIFPHWIALPKQRPLLFTASCIRNEVARGQEFSMTLVGSSPRNYISVGDCIANPMIQGTAVNTDMLMLWEV